MTTVPARELETLVVALLGRMDESAELLVRISDVTRDCATLAGGDLADALMRIDQSTRNVAQLLADTTATVRTIDPEAPVT